jgi:uncharacterized membrane protein (DUF2068 family)
MAAQEHKGLRLIAIFKLFKAAGLLLLAITAFGLVRQADLDAFAGWISHLPIQNGHGYVVRALDSLLELGPRKFIALGIAACVYATLFAVEGWGLWNGKRWAEYLTVIATASLIPLEIWELHHGFTWVKLGALVLNVVIVLYLIKLLREKPAKR